MYIIILHVKHASTKFSTSAFEVIVYKSIWAPAFGETLAFEVEFGNIHDPSTVAVCKPGKFLLFVIFFIRRAGIIISLSQ